MVHLPISVFIIALNEADRIGRCIESVRGWVDEIIVVDSGSTDGTPAVAEAKGAKVIFNAWPGYGEQKRFGEDLCRNDWILNIDADEAVSLELALEIQKLFDAGVITACDFWTVDIRDVWAHEVTPAKHAYGYKQIRLYNRTIGRFSKSTVHDTVRPPKGAQERHLEGIIEHRSIRSIEFQVNKMNRYSTMQVADLRKRGRVLPRFRLLSEFPIAFLKAYFIRKYCLYGWWGIVISTNYAFSRFLRVAKALEAELIASKNKSI
ncbi:glycosyltransferase family 2 protein [Polycladidibacter stylochi]|uniref:glycosyltransferase family 2 protein n=1 Tax=Polycladidibacter stylochi TaxID=1807766 RepID=UPI00082EC91D|nr:glycosyltransferase family 2 protein [Pseudovibrio stylochi]